MSQGKILFAERGNACLIKLAGEVKFTVSGGLDALIERLFAEGHVGEVTIDLNDAEHIDSTCLGLLAKIARLLVARDSRKPVIVSTGEDINILLDSMAFDQAFVMEQRASPDVGELEEVTNVTQNRDDRAKTLLESHQTLMNMSDENRARFGNTVDMLERETREKG